MNLKALAVGAGEEQIFFIEEAQKLGIYVIAVDGNPLARGLTVANEGYCIDIKNEEKIIELAKKHAINFVIPVPIGSLITTMGAVNDALNLKGVTRKQAELFSDKEKFKEFKITHGFYNPKELSIKEPTIFQIQAALEEWNCCCILRPSKGSGSRGIVLVEKEDSALIQEHLDALLPTEHCLISEFVKGIEYGVDLVISDKVYILSIREKLLTDMPYRQETGFTIVIDNSIQEKVKKEFEKLVHIVRLKNVMMHADVIIDGEQIFIIEASPRPAGLGIYENLLNVYYREPVVQQCINIMTNDNNDCVLTDKTNFIGLYFWDLPNKKITKALDYSKDGIIKFKFNLNINDTVPTVKQGADIYKRGYFLLKANTKEAILDLRQNVLDSVVR
ncbi:ATP-grasp domain-containing protein [Lysinibacillus sp. FSL K6-4013]|uniref:ATP-grasp domain-containing protein n=1 Tax=unclassified Lysinibacillus TaxID=2636778 RepID=UPI00315A0733